MAIVSWLISSFLSLWPIIAVVIIIVLSTILFFKRSKNEETSWSDGLPEIKPGPIFGNDVPTAEGFSIQYNLIYKAMKGLKYCLYYNGGSWAFGTKRLLILDPTLVAKIMITDFDHFSSTLFFSPKYMEAMGNVFGIADAQGERWKRLRKAANGPFSLLKMKKYMHYFTKAGKEMVEYVEKESLKGDKVDATEFVKRSVINTLGAVGFGMEANAFTDKESELKKQGEALSEMWRWISVMMTPSIATFFRINVYNPKAEKWWTSLMRRHITNRKSQVEDQHDILSTLIKVHEEDPKDFDQIAMEKTILQFIFDGYNSVSAQTTGVLAFIVAHPEVASKLQNEIDEIFDAKEDGDIDLTDTDVIGMNYLDCVIMEVQRISCISITSRGVSKPWKIPDTDITLPVGASVYIPISAFHMDPDYWENPSEFDPERFNAENKNKIKTGTYLPLGLGPRQCLGYSYTKFTIKMLVIYLLRFFDLENCENLPKNFELDPNTGNMGPKGGLKIKFHKRVF